MQAAPEEIVLAVPSASTTVIEARDHPLHFTLHRLLLEVLALITQGLSNLDIATRTSLSINSAASCRTHGRRLWS